jgi:hypothetical protein
LQEEYFYHNIKSRFCQGGNMYTVTTMREEFVGYTATLCWHIEPIYYSFEIESTFSSLFLGLILDLEINLSKYLLESDAVKPYLF